MLFIAERQTEKFFDTINYLQMTWGIVVKSPQSYTILKDKNNHRFFNIMKSTLTNLNCYSQRLQGANFKPNLNEIVRG